ncbi:MAG: response regulator [Alphaproteobacteria bacterium]|nr:response regulator [Alphaproteobacteria bacterium]
MMRSVNRMQPTLAGEAEADQTESRVQREMKQISQRYLCAVAAVFGCYYFLRSLGFFFVNPGGTTGLYLGAPTAVAAIVGGLVFYFSKSRELPRMVIEACFFVICLFLLFNTGWAYHYEFSPGLMTNLAFAMIAVGLGTVSFWNWLAQIMAILIGYQVMSSQLGLIDDEPFIFYLVSGVALSLLAYLARMWVIRDRVRLEVELIDKAGKLEAANKAKDRFLANMTHDLRTPMTGVLGMMDLLRETRLDKEQVELLNTAKTSAGYLMAIINDILDYSKLESGKFELKPAPMDAVAITRDVTEMLRSQAVAKQIGLELDLPEKECVAVQGDGVRVGQVLFNLIGNAIKFTEKGDVTVKMRCHEGSEQSYIEWSIRDTGAGIPQDRIHKLFHRFEQLDASSTRQQQAGTGLGLAIIKELLELMGGEVRVESQIGVGTEFAFTIPFEGIDPALLQKQAEMAVTRKNLDMPLRILVVEDNQVNQALISKLLTNQGWQFQIAENGEAAVASVTKSEEPFDLVLMDVQMPVMDGMTATRIIRDKMVSPPPIIALTANTMKDDVERYLAAGMQAHIGKPIDLEVLRSTIQRVLAGKQ